MPWDAGVERGDRHSLELASQEREVKRSKRNETPSSFYVAHDCPNLCPSVRGSYD